MPKATFPRDRFDEIGHDAPRVGAHRAPRPRGRWVALALWWLLAVAVLTGGGILAFLALSNTDTIDLPVPPTFSQDETEEAVEGVVDTDYFVLVLNGTADDAVLESVSESVAAAGWDESMIASLSSDATDFQTTTVFYVDAEDEAAARGLADVLGVTSVEQNADFDEQSEGGLTVVIGVDRLL